MMLGLPRGRAEALLVAGLIITVSSTYFIVPFLAEKSWTAEPFSSAIISLHIPTSRELYDFVAWGATGKGSDASSYLGISVLAVLLAGALASLRAAACREQVRRFLALFAAIALLTLPLAGSYVRQALFTTFFIAAAAATAVQILIEAFPSRTGLPVLILAVFLADVGPTAVQPWVRPDMRSLERAGAALAERAPAERVIETEYGPGGFFISVGPDSSPLHFARVQMLYGPHKMDATKAHNAMVAVLQMVQDDLDRTGSLDSGTAGLVSLYNVGWLVGHQRNRMGLPATVPGIVADDVIGAHLRIATAAPFVASGRLLPTQMPDEFGGFPYWQEDFLARSPRTLDAKQAAREAYEKMEVDLAQRQAAAILVQKMPDGNEWPQGSNEPPLVELLDYRVDPGHVRLVVNADRPGFLRLSHPFYPTLHVTENGRTIGPVPDVFSMMVVPLQAGRTDIEVVAIPSVLRRACFAITGACLVGLVVGLIVLLGLSSSRAAAGESVPGS
jgi:hypothetical protein